MKIAWDPRHSSAWDELHESVAGPLQQHFAFGQALQALGSRCLRAHVSVNGELIGIAQFIARRPLGLLGLALCSHGPVWRAGSPPEVQQQACRLMSGSVPLRRPRFALYAPEQGSLPGLTRVFTGATTVLLDLSRPDDELRRSLHPKWRNRLVAAEASPLRFQRAGEKPAQYQWLLDREGVQRQARAYRALPAEFVPAWQVAVASITPHRSALLTVRCDIGREPVAAMMFLLHGRSATYHLGWSNDQGRQHNAHNLLLWRALGLLREQEVVQLDLGGVNTQRGATLARFKLGTGGRVAVSPGTYL